MDSRQTQMPARQVAGSFLLVEWVRNPELSRMDAGNDAAVNVQQCREEGRAYIYV